MVERASETSRQFQIHGENYTLTTELVTVVHTDSRSDTHVHGGGFVTGSTNRYGGDVFGVSKVTSSVSVTRDVYFIREDGTEGHYRSNVDIAVRERHHLRFLFLEGPRTVKHVGIDKHGRNTYSRVAKLLAGVQVVETGEFYKLDPYDDNGRMLALPQEKFFLAGWKLLLAGLALTLFYGIGLLLLLYLLFRTISVAAGAKHYGFPETVALQRIREARATIQNEIDALLRERPASLAAA